MATREDRDEGEPTCLTCGGFLPRQTVEVRFEDRKPYTLEEAQEMVSWPIIKIRRRWRGDAILKAWVWNGRYKDDLFCCFNCVDKFARTMARQFREVEAGRV